MISMENWATRASEKLSREQSDIPAFKMETIGEALRNPKTAAASRAWLMSDPVKKQLLEFCVENENFAKAVAEGGNFAECMKKIAEKVGNYAQGQEICEKAAQFYAPGARVRAQFVIVLHDDAPEESNDIISVDFGNFF